MIEIFLDGGPMMYPILLCSIIGWAIFLERLRYYHQVGRSMLPLVREVSSHLNSGEQQQALECCSRFSSPLAIIFRSLLDRPRGQRSELKERAEDAGSRQVVELQRYLNLLATIANIAPLLGLLGTVLGMIDAFKVIARSGVSTPATLGGGISQALITTAAGLTVAVPMILVHRYLASRAERIALDLENHSMRLVDQLMEP